MICVHVGTIATCTYAHPGVHTHTHQPKLTAWHTLVGIKKRREENVKRWGYSTAHTSSIYISPARRRTKPSIHSPLCLPFLFPHPPLARLRRKVIWRASGRPGEPSAEWQRRTEWWLGPINTQRQMKRLRRLPSSPVTMQLLNRVIAR